MPSVRPFHYRSFIKAGDGRRVPPPLAQVNGRERKKKKGHRSPCEKNNRLSAGDATFQRIVQLQVSAIQPDFLRDDTHRSVPLSRRELSLSSLCICYVLMCVSHIYGLRLIVIIVLSSGLRTLSRREERRRWRQRRRQAAV